MDLNKYFPEFLLLKYDVERDEVERVVRGISQDWELLGLQLHVLEEAMRSFDKMMSKESVEYYEMTNAEYFNTLVELLKDEKVAGLDLFKRGWVNPNPVQKRRQRRKPATPNATTQEEEIAFLRKWFTPGKKNNQRDPEEEKQEDPGSDSDAS